MRLIILLLLCWSLLLSQEISAKLIVSGDKNSTMAQMYLLKLKMHFIENPQMSVLQEKYQLNFVIETLDEYTMVVIKPIRSMIVKNELLLLLSPLFPNIFLIEDNKRDLKQLNDLKEQKKMNMHVMCTNILHQAKLLVDEIGLQWLILLFLSIIGLILSLKSRRRMSMLENIQKDLSLKQEQIEHEIKKLGI